MFDKNYKKKVEESKNCERRYYDQLKQIEKIYGALQYFRDQFGSDSKTYFPPEDG